MYWNVWDNNKIKESKTCINSNDNKFLNHDLKKNSVPSRINDINANGLKSTNIWINIYLNEYVNIKLIIPIVEKDFIMPSNEKRLYIESLL